MAASPPIHSTTTPVGRQNLELRATKTLPTPAGTLSLAMVVRLVQGLRLVALFVGGHRAVALENLALRQQLAMYRRRRLKPAARWPDRLFWVGLRRLWPDWASALVVVRPATVIGWHRRGFSWYWARRSRTIGGRPALDRHLRQLILRMAEANPLWGAPRIHGELLKLGLNVSERTISRLLPRRRRPPSQTWRTFLQNHVGTLVAVDFFTVPTVTCRVLFVFVVLAHDRRRILHVNVTPHPTSTWTRQQLREAFPWHVPSRFVLHDRDAIFDVALRSTVAALGLAEVRTAPRSPWQNPFVERVIGSIRRECLDHVIVLNERHLRRVLRDYVGYYHRSRTHLALDKDTPESRPVDAAAGRRIVAVPQVGGLHHRYERRAA
jgi:putative transposase